MPDKVVVCQNVTCKKQGAAEVLEALQQQAPKGVAVEPSGCLGHCGNGPMVLTEPDNFWYHQMSAKDVPRIVSQHLAANRPVKAKLCSTMHTHENHILLWVIGIGVFLCLCALIAFVTGARYQYH